jgi:16S rRNA G966 N2-methylase RsmD
MNTIINCDNADFFEKNKRNQKKEFDFIYIDPPYNSHKDDQTQYKDVFEKNYYYF